MHVFTYGTLMFPEVWRAVVGRDFQSVRGSASGYAIYRVQNAVFPGITPAGDTEKVAGTVYLDVDQASLARLDLFEDDFYERQGLWVACEDGQTRVAEAYVVPDQNRAVLTEEVWLADEFVARGHLNEFIERFAGFTRLADND